MAYRYLHIEADKALPDLATMRLAYELQKAAHRENRLNRAKYDKSKKDKKS